MNGGVHPVGSLSSAPGLGSVLTRPVQRTFRRGQVAVARGDLVLQIQEGMAALTAAHHDGTEVLLGLVGPGEFLIQHPIDLCHVAAVALTDLQVVATPWDELAVSPRFASQLRAQLLRMEGWTAMQAHPYVDRRILGILTLLGERFGRPHPSGLLVDVRLTHAQLASAVGATRATVTRLLTNLERAGEILVVGRGADRRYCLPSTVAVASHTFAERNN